MKKRVSQAVIMGMAGVTVAALPASAALATSETKEVGVETAEGEDKQEGVMGTTENTMEQQRIASMGELMGDYSIHDNCCYYSVMAFNLVSSSLEEGTEISEVQIGYKSVEESEDSADTQELFNVIGKFEGSEGSVTLKDDITTDSLYIRYLLSDGSYVEENASVVYPELLDVYSYVKDSESPVVSFSEFTGETSKSGTIVKNGNLVFDVKDDVLVDESRFIVSEKNAELDASYIDGKLSIPTNQLSNDSHELSITAFDECNNGSVIKYSLAKRTATPPITGSSHNGASYVGGVTYIRTTLSVSLDGTDDSSIKKISLLKDGVEVQEITNGAFTISTAGTYAVRVVDSEDNATTYGLEDLFSDLGSRVVVDGVLPTAEFKVNGVEPVDTWYTGATTGVIHVEDNEGIERIQLIVNGKDCSVNCNGATSYDASIDFANDIPRSTDGEYRLDYTVYDNAGNIYHETKTIKCDFDDPTIENVKVTGAYTKVDNMFFAKGNLTLNASPKDIGSGVRSLSILKDGIEVATSFPYTIGDNGSYTFKVTDNAGRSSKEYTLGDLLGLSGSSGSVIVDGSAPEFELGNGFTPDLDDNGNWYKSEPTFEFSVKDDNLKDVSATLNGDSIPVKGSNSKYTISTEGYVGRNALVLTAVDCAGNSKVQEFHYKVDKDAPSDVDAVVDTKFIERFGKIFFKDSPTISLSAKDEVGVLKYLLDDEESENGKFSLKEGKHTVQVYDKLGNHTEEIPLGELIGARTPEEVVIDGESPVIDCKRPTGDIDGWYSKDVEYNAVISDDKGIYSYTATINGKEVASYTASQHAIKEKDFKIDTSKVEAASNGSYSIVIETEDSAGNTSVWSDIIYIDREPPKVDKFVFTGDGSKEGVTIDGKDRYGFFFNGKAKCSVHVSDGVVSSGMDKVFVTLISNTGSRTKKQLNLSGGVATFDIPNNFKGTVEAYATDKVGNTGNVNKPDGIVTEDSNCHINNVLIDINLPNSVGVDAKGNSLYSNDVTATAKLGCTASGVKTVEWGINEETKGAVNISLDGTMSGDSTSIVAKDKNLLVDLSKVLNVAENSNDIKLWVRVIDRAGHVSEEHKTLSIDKDAPILEVTYDVNEDDNYYNQTRTANITVKERNFDPNKIKVEGKFTSLGSWVNSGDIWRNTIVFNDDGEYQFSVSSEDLARNKGKDYNSEKFVIDKTAPTISVTWDNNSPANGNFYKSTRTATVLITERNFSADRVKLEGSGVLSSWSSAGDTHRATISFDSDGEYEFNLSCTDLADNTSNVYSEPKFIIDTTMPALAINGVENGVSYKKNLGLSVSMSDTYLNKDSVKVSLVGRKNGEITLNQSVNAATGMFELSAFPEEEGFDDLYTLSAEATDMAGNTVKNSVIFSLNRFGSKYAFLEGELLGNYINKARDITITEQNVDKLDISKARIAVIYEGKELAVDPSLLSMTESGGEKDSFNYTYKVGSSAFAKDGKYSVQIYSKAVEGTDYSSVAEEYEFVLDTKKPNIVVSGVESGGRYKEYQKRVMIDVRDMSGVKDIVVSINGKKVPVDKTDGIYSVTMGESSDVQEFVCSVTDLAGNISNKKLNDILISSSIFDYVINQPWFRYAASGVGALLLVIIAFLLKMRSDSRKREIVTMQEHETMYKETSSSSSLETGSSSSSQKDEVSELDAGTGEVVSTTELKN